LITPCHGQASAADDAAGTAARQCVLLSCLKFGLVHAYVFGLNSRKGEAVSSFYGSRFLLVLHIRADVLASLGHHIKKENPIIANAGNARRIKRLAAYVSELA